MMGSVREIGRRFLVGVRGTHAGDPQLESDLDACDRVGIRGVVLFDHDLATGGPRNIESKQQVCELITHIRARLGSSAIIAVDQEGGRVARCRPEHGFAAIPSAEHAGTMPLHEQRVVARALAQDLSDVGIDLNFAPCADLDLGCPVISGLGRSYGGFDRVVESSRIVIDELQAHGVMACVKHFPGHGSALLDSHHELPDVTGTFQDEELDVFRKLLCCEPTPGAVMTGHLLHRDFDEERPASVSRTVTTDVLCTEFAFEGLVITDSLDMGALRRRFSLEEASRLAIDAGADLLVHACNSSLGETAEDVAMTIEHLAQR